MKKNWGALILLSLCFILLTASVSFADVAQLLATLDSYGRPWVRACNGTLCGNWILISGVLSEQPTVVWDQYTGRYYLYGIVSNGNIWVTSFNASGVWNNDWTQTGGSSAYPISAASGDIKTDKWLDSGTNTFFGVGAAGAGQLTHNPTLYDSGFYNTAFGYNSLHDISTGLNNTAIGNSAGANQTTGNGNIYIGNDVYGVAGESTVTRIGLAGQQTATYIAGIYGSVIGTSNPVLVNSNGRLGTSASSRRFKEEICDMGESSSRLMALRPVTFRYKKEIDQEERPLQYGLIAEEVAGVYPELVQYEKDGKPFAVRYHELGPMLLNEVQKQAEQIKKLSRALDEKDVRIRRLEKLLEEVQERVAVMETPAKTVASK